MNLTGILKSLLLVVFSMIIWATSTTFTQGIGYIIALVGMVYYAFPPDSAPIPRQILGHLRAYLPVGSKTKDSSHVSRSMGDYRSVSENLEHDFEDSFLLDYVDEGKQSDAYSEGRRSEASFRNSMDKPGVHKD